MKYEIKPLSESEAATVREKLAEYERSVAPGEPGVTDEKVVFKITDGGELAGGLIATFDKWRTLELVNLWIDERCRGRRLASALICEAERAARERGCVLSIVATWSFQARPLYEKHGYTLCSTITDWPKGYDSYYLSKRLDNAAPDDVPPQIGFEIERGGDADGEFIHGKLHEFNCAKIPRTHGHTAVARKLEDGGEMIAGCVADKDSLDIAIIGSIWVDEAHRGRGAGSLLLGEVERELKADGGIFAVVYVFDWNVGFFRKNGYAECGRIDDRPAGHSEFIMKKIL